MKIAFCLLLIAFTTFAKALPQSQTHSRHAAAAVGLRRADADISILASEELWKRKGGGGGGGGGGKGGGGGSSGGRPSSSASSSIKGGDIIIRGGSSGGSSAGGSSTAGGAGGAGGKGSSSSSTGGRTTSGSGVAPSYGRGYYGGGAAVPYTSGGRSASGITPLLFVGAGAFAVFPALWLYSVYSYPYSHPYTFRNLTSHRNETKPINCLCEQYSECGCDENGDNSQLDTLVGNGDYNTLNKSIITVVDINGTSTILINGTLPNGTTAAGGTDDPDGTTDDPNGASTLVFSGYWIMIVLVGCIVFLT